MDRKKKQCELARKSDYRNTTSTSVFQLLNKKLEAISRKVGVFGYLRHGFQHMSGLFEGTLLQWREHILLKIVNIFNSLQNKCSTQLVVGELMTAAACSSFYMY